VIAFIREIVADNERLRRDNAKLRAFATRVTTMPDPSSMADEAAALLARISEEGDGSGADSKEVRAS